MNASSVGLQYFGRSSFNMTWHDIWRTDAIGTCHYAPWHFRFSVAHAKNLWHVNGCHWHMPKTCDMSMDAIGTCQKPVTCQWMPLAHAKNLWHVNGCHWHMPETCDMSMDCVLCHNIALRVAPSVVTDTCRWVPLHNVDCVTQALNVRTILI